MILYMSETRLTLETTEGPYYKEGSPPKSILRERSTVGERLVVGGRVLNSGGAPLSNAWLDFWQADGKGRYDNSGYALRGHQFTDASGRYRLETVIPGGYPGRTPHIHVKVKSPDGKAALTTQLFMPGMATNATDSIFRDELVVRMSETAEGKKATFDFVLDSN